MPKVSVIMPSYNKERYIKESIESILNQTYRDFELIIIDDGSSDNSVEIIKAYQDERVVFTQNQKNLGIAATRNLALDKARGEYIALLDGDDISTEFRLEKEVCFLENNPDIDVVFGGFLEIDENNVVKETFFSALKNPDFIKARLMVQNVIPNGSCMYRKGFVDKYGIRYRDGYLGMEDYLFWVECSLYGRMAGMSDLFLYWRNTTNNGTNVYMHSPEYREKRIEKYAEIQRYALKGNGFVLTGAELQLYNKLLSETKYWIKEEHEVMEFFELIKKICYQAEDMSNAKEIKMVFKRQFGMSLENSYIWETKQ